MTTNTTDTPAIDLKAGDMIIYRSRFRTVLNVALDTDDDGTDYVYVVLEAMTGQPLNAWLSPDDMLPVLR